MAETSSKVTFPTKNIVNHTTPKINEEKRWKSGNDVINFTNNTTEVQKLPTISTITDIKDEELYQDDDD